MVSVSASRAVPRAQAPAAAPPDPQASVVLIPGGANYSRGALSVLTAEKSPTGVQVTINTTHQANGDTIALSLYTQANGTWVNLGQIAQGLKPNPSSATGQIKLDIPQSWITQKLAQYGITGAVAGRAFEIGGTWQTNHVWGLNHSGRPGGAFKWP